VAAFPTAHTLARLRIAGRVTASVARLATGWAGSPLAGRGLHPLDDKPNFMRLSHLSLLSDQPYLVALFGLSPPSEGMRELNGRNELKAMSREPTENANDFETARARIL
jgi:hypothetical protein